MVFIPKDGILSVSVPRSSLKVLWSDVEVSKLHAVEGTVSWSGMDKVEKGKEKPLLMGSVSV